MFRNFLHLKPFEFVKQEDAIMKNLIGKGVTAIFSNSTGEKYSEAVAIEMLLDTLHTISFRQPDIAFAID